MSKKGEREFRAKDNRGILAHLGTRLLLMVIGYAAVLVLLVSIVSAYGTYYFFGREDVEETWDFLQTGYVKGQLIAEGFYPTVSRMRTKEQYYELNIPSRRIRIRNVHNGKVSSKYLTLEEILEAEMDYTYGTTDDFLTNVSAGILPEYGYVDTDYRMPMPRDFAGTKEYYKIDSSDFMKLAKKSEVVNNFASLYVEDVSGEGKARVLSEEGQELLDRILSSEELSMNFYLPEKFDDDNIDFARLTGEYYLWMGDTIFICSFRDNLMYNDFVGVQRLQNDDTIYYIPSNYVNEEAYEFSILLAPHFTLATDVIIASLDEEAYSVLSEYCRILYESQFSDNDIEYAEISMVKEKGEPERVLRGDSSRGTITAQDYPTYAQRIRDNYDVVIYSDGKNVQSFYKNEVTGQRTDFNYLSSNEEWIKDLIPSDSKITVGMKLGQGSRRAKILYRYCQMVPQPVSIGIMAGILLLVVIFLLSIGVEGYTIIEHFPIELNLLFTLGFIFAGALLTWEVLSYTSLTSVLNPSNPVNMAAILSVIAFYYIIIAEMYLTVVRRVKRRVLIKELLLVRFFTWLAGLIGNGIRKISADRMVMITMVALSLANAVAIPVGAVIYEETYSVVGVILLGTLILLIDVVSIVRFYNYYRMLDDVLETSKKIENGDFEAHVDTEKLRGLTKDLGDSLNNIRNGLQDAVEQSTRDERLKAELITNVSHDIKTPITSIINYVELLKWEKTDNPKITEYIEVLDKKAQRLKQLILDLVEASKVSTGNIELELMNIDFAELLSQTVGEYEDRFPERDLSLLVEIPETPVIIYADGRRIFRIVENLFQNVLKYSLQGTRVYVQLSTVEEADGVKKAVFSIKNISQERLNVSAEDLTRRFVRGDQARNTEGSGLGLSIAKNLTTLQNGDLKLIVDGDLFKAEVSFPVVETEESNNG